LHHDTKILIYGYGNPGRQDDGLGNHFVDKAKEWAEAEGLKNISFDSNYQLSIEDAAEISDKDIVIFIDASVEDLDTFLLEEIAPNAKVEFSMHSVSASYVVQLCNDIYDRTPKSLLLHIKGFEWAFKEGITKPALDNFKLAFDYMKPLLKDPEKLFNHR
jgi:hydrogenase maturation protease